MIRKLVGYLSLFKSLYFSMRGNASKARYWFNDALQRAPAKDDFIDAYDARIMMMEGRHSEAREKLDTVVGSLDGKTDDDARYIKLYCHFFLALYEGNPKAVELKARVCDLDPSRVLFRFLPFFDDGAISRVLAKKGVVHGRPNQTAEVRMEDVKVSIEI